MNHPPLSTAFSSQVILASGAEGAAEVHTRGVEIVTPSVIVADGITNATSFVSGLNEVLILENVARQKARITGSTLLVGNISVSNMTTPVPPEGEIPTTIFIGMGNPLVKEAELSLVDTMLRVVGTLLVSDLYLTDNTVSQEILVAATSISYGLCLDACNLTMESAHLDLSESTIAAPQ